MRERILQAEAMGEYPLSTTLRAIIREEQQQEIHLSAALDLNPSQLEVATSSSMRTEAITSVR